MARKAFSTTLDAGLLEDLKLLAVKLHRPVNTLLEEAAEKFLREKGSEDPDLAIFRARAREPEENCMREIEARLRRIKARRA